jgi:hypothetical protein
MAKPKIACSQSGGLASLAIAWRYAGGVAKPKIGAKRGS